MTDQWDNADGDAGQQNNNGGGLRKQLEQTLARLRELESENATLKTQTRQAAISGVLAEKKYPAKVAKLIPSDVEPTADAVQKWLDEFGDVFNIQKDEASGGGSDDTSGAPEGAAEEVNPEAAMEYIQTMRQMGAIGGGLLPPAKAQDLLAKVNDPQLTQEGLLALINSHGGGVGMG